MNACGGEAQNRTGDTRIFSPLLYRLSYLAETVRELTGSFKALSSTLSPFFLIIGFNIEAVFQLQDQPVDNRLFLFRHINLGRLRRLLLR